MLVRKIIAAVAAGSLALSSAAALAQSDRNHDRGDHPGDHRVDNSRGYDDHGHDGRGAGPDHNWVRGSRLPPEYRSHSYVVDDWRGHHLQQPPHGYHWVQAGGDYVLAAIATGIIASVIINQ